MIHEILSKHCFPDETGDGCFRMVTDIVRSRLGNEFRFEPPEYLKGIPSSDWTAVAKSMHGSLLLGWQEHLDAQCYLRGIDIADIQPGDIAISDEGDIALSYWPMSDMPSMIGVISESYEMICRSRNGLHTVSPIHSAWRIQPCQS